MAFTLRNFYHPAPRQVQRMSAALKGVSGLLMASTFLTKYPWLGGVGLVMAIVAEALEKLSGDPNTPGPPKDEASTPNAPGAPAE
jgi:hypothetical protein